MGEKSQNKVIEFQNKILIELVTFFYRTLQILKNS